MNDISRGIITLIRSAITKEKRALPKDFSWQEAYPLIKAQQIANIVYEGAVNCGVDKTEPIMQVLFRKSYQYLVQSTKQMAAIQKVYDAFDAAEVDYMPLKGCNLKKLYPKPELRIMGDADILIRLEQYRKIVPILKANGYRLIKESNHELVWDNGSLHLELHKSLVSDHHKVASDYYGNGWDFAIKQTQYRYAMRPENELIYLFAHFTNHYRDGGIGCRQLVDIWLYLQNHPHMDQAYLRSQLEKMRLLAFYDNVCHTMDVWFADKPEDPMSDHISKAVFYNGSWGTMERRSVSEISRNTTVDEVKVRKRKKVWWTIFPQLARMIEIYPVLRKCPVLLPIMWFVRWLEILFKQRKRAAMWIKSNQSVTTKDVKEYQDEMSYVGLSFEY